MIKYEKRDVTTVTKGIVAHGTNCQGQMGAGVALAIRETWPKVYGRYKQLCDNAESSEKLLGTAQFVSINELAPLVVANVFTQEYYGGDGKQYASLEAINRGLLSVVKEAYLNHMDVYLPPIGTGLGGIAMDDFKNIIEGISEFYPEVNIYVCDI